MKLKNTWFNGKSTGAFKVKQVLVADREVLFITSFNVSVLKWFVVFGSEGVPLSLMVMGKGSLSVLPLSLYACKVNVTASFTPSIGSVIAMLFVPVRVSFIS